MKGGKGEVERRKKVNDKMWERYEDLNCEGEIGL